MVGKVLKKTKCAPSRELPSEIHPTAEATDDARFLEGLNAANCFAPETSVAFGRPMVAGIEKRLQRCPHSLVALVFDGRRCFRPRKSWQPAQWLIADSLWGVIHSHESLWETSASPAS